MRAITRGDFSPGRYLLRSYELKQLACPICGKDAADAQDCAHSEEQIWKALGGARIDPHGGTAEAIAREIDHGVPPSDWFARYLTGDKKARKEAPIARGLHGYFPNACVNVAHVSYVANEQHNPGLPMQWAFDKSTDEADCQVRHGIDAAAAPFDGDGLLHLAKKAWRAMAELERYLLENYPGAKPGASVTGFERKAK